MSLSPPLRGESNNTALPEGAAAPLVTDAWSRAAQLVWLRYVFPISGSYLSYAWEKSFKSENKRREAEGVCTGEVSPLSLISSGGAARRPDQIPFTQPMIQFN